MAKNDFPFIRDANAESPQELLKKYFNNAWVL